MVAQWTEKGESNPSSAPSLMNLGEAPCRPPPAAFVSPAVNQSDRACGSQDYERCVNKDLAHRQSWGSC